MNKGTKRIAIGTLIAGIVGYIAGILTAPKSGAQTRDDIRSATASGMAEAEKKLKQLHTELNNLLDDASAEGRQLADKLRAHGSALDADVVEKAGAVRQKTREIISAIHDGSADDKDLDKAVNEATKAIKALRNYLKK